MAPWAERVKPSRGSRSVGVLGGVNAQEPKAELGLVRGGGNEGVTIAHALHGSRQAAGGSGVGGGRKEQEDCCNDGEADSPSVHAQPA
jgi:hypothetical protein